MILDIDGTLLDSCASDAELYVEAIRHVLGPVRIREAWGHYPRVTDTGILSDICSDNSLHFDEEISSAVMDSFVSRLAAHVAASGPYREIEGALAFVRGLCQRPDTRVAYATGGWRASAQIKLVSAGFPLEGIPLASASDHQDRTAIMLHALRQLGGPFNAITYYGDGIWDEAATTALGWSFIAVGPKLNGILKYDAVSPNKALQRSGEP